MIKGVKFDIFCFPRSLNIPKVALTMVWQSPTCGELPFPKSPPTKPEEGRSATTQATDNQNGMGKLKRLLTLKSCPFTKGSSCDSMFAIASAKSS